MAKDPPAHAVQDDAPAALKYPGSHAATVLAPVEPTKEPEGEAVHDVDPELAAKEPSAHAVHALAPAALKEPGLHGAHDDALGYEENWPLGHTPHSVEEVARGR